MKNMVRLSSGWLTAAVCAVALVAPAQGQSKEILKSSPQVVGAFKDVVNVPSKSVVRIECDGKAAALGTVIEADGWILTKASELKGKVVCKTGDKEYEAKIVGLEEKYDLALLKIDAKGLKAVALTDSKATPVGFWVASVGTTSEPVAVGVLSVSSRNPSPREFPRAANPSGGYLGIALADEEVAGAKIAEVTPNMAAAKAGVQKDDIILAVDTTTIKNGEALVATLGKYKPNDEVTLKLKRGDKEMTLKATLGKRPSAGVDRGDMQNSMGSKLSNKRTGFPTILQHDSVVKPEDCGGPLVNLDGQVIGINIARAGRVESWAIPAESIKPLLADLKSGKLAPVVAPAGPSPAVIAAKAAMEAAQKELVDSQKKVDAAKDALKKAEEALKKAEEEDRKKNEPKK